VKISLKRVTSVVAVLAVAAAASLVNVPGASAAPPGTPPNGSLTLTPPSGNSDTDFVLDPDDPQVCPGDGATDGYRWQTFMTPTSIDPATLTYGGTGPQPQGGEFTQPLFDTGANPVINRNPDVGTANISGIPTMDFAVFGPGVVPAGEYFIGIACTLSGMTETFWSVPITITTNASTGGSSQLDYAKGAKPVAPVLTSLTPDDGSLTTAFTHATSDPPTTQFTVTATPTGGGTPVTATGAASPIAVSGLTNGTSYDVTVRATNSVGDSPESNMLQGTPNPAPRPPVQNLTATPGTGQVDLTWDPPASGPAPIGYQVDVAPNEGTMSHTGTDTTAEVTGLTAGTTYTFTVTPLHPSPYVGTPASVQAAPFADSVLVQDVTVVRPVGALVLTQVCGRYGALPSVPAQTGFAAGLPAQTVVAGGVAPNLEDGTDDPEFPEYPYPENPDGTPSPNYPTHCGVDLGTAKFVKSGPGAGQFFAASGRLNQVTVVDTRNLDEGWTVNGTMSAFNSGSDSFSGSQLGWVPALTDDTDLFNDANGDTYDQVASAGGVIAPNTLASAGGLSNPSVLGSAAEEACAGGTPDACTGGLGIAAFDARLLLLIPITADSGTYVGTLTLSAI
jgi:hypothetical protein